MMGTTAHTSINKCDKKNSKFLCGGQLNGVLSQGADFIVSVSNQCESFATNLQHRFHNLQLIIFTTIDVFHLGHSNNIALPHIIIISI